MRGKPAFTGLSLWLLHAANCANFPRQMKIEGTLVSRSIFLSPMSQSRMRRESSPVRPEGKGRAVCCRAKVHKAFYGLPERSQPPDYTAPAQGGLRGRKIF